MIVGDIFDALIADDEQSAAGMVFQQRAAAVASAWRNAAGMLADNITAEFRSRVAAIAVAALEAARPVSKSSAKQAAKLPSSSAQPASQVSSRRRRGVYVGSARRVPGTAVGDLEVGRHCVRRSPTGRIAAVR